LAVSIQKGDFACDSAASARRVINLPFILVSPSVPQTSADSSKKKIVGVFYKAGEYADNKNPNFVGCVEGALGIRNWLESQGHHYIVTDDKEGLNSGK
jgi:formate dehydrogenase